MQPIFVLIGLNLPSPQARQLFFMTKTRCWGVDGLLKMNVQHRTLNIEHRMKTNIEKYPASRLIDEELG